MQQRHSGSVPRTPATATHTISLVLTSTMTLARCSSVTMTPQPTQHTTDT